MPLDKFDFSQPGWKIIAGRWENKDLEKRVAEEQEAERAKAQELEKERAVLPRIVHLETEVRTLQTIVNGYLEIFKEIGQWQDKANDKNKERNARLDALEAENKSLREEVISLKSTSTSAERTHTLAERITATEFRVAKVEDATSAHRKHLSNLENKIAKRELPSLK